jgi:hypothetical protein
VRSQKSEVRTEDGRCERSVKLEKRRTGEGEKEWTSGEEKN